MNEKEEGGEEEGERNEEVEMNDEKISFQFLFYTFRIFSTAPSLST